MRENTFMKKLDKIRQDATKAVVNKVENIHLNRSGTIGTEKIAYPVNYKIKAEDDVPPGFKGEIKRDSKGDLRAYPAGAFENKVDLKFGKLGKISIPTGTMSFKRPPANAGSDFHQRAQAFIASAKAKGYTVKAEGDQLIAYPPEKKKPFKPMNSKPSNGIGVGGN